MPSANRCQRKEKGILPKPKIVPEDRGPRTPMRGPKESPLCALCAGTSNIVRPPPAAASAANNIQTTHNTPSIPRTRGAATLPAAGAASTMM